MSLQAVDIATVAGAFFAFVGAAQWRESARRDDMESALAWFLAGVIGVLATVMGTVMR